MLDRHAQHARYQRRERRQQRRPRRVVEPHLIEVLRRYAVVAPAEAQWLEDLLREHLAHRLAGDALNDLAENEPARDGVVCESRSGLDEWLGLVDCLAQELAVADTVEIEGRSGQAGETGPMREHVPNRCVLLAVHAVLRDVIGHAVRYVQRAPLLEQVDHHRCNRLRG